MTYEEELAKRLALLEQPAYQGQGFDTISCLWMLFGCIILPALLLAWGW
jgi:hypothetical protein